MPAIPVGVNWKPLIEFASLIVSGNRFKESYLDAGCLEFLPGDPSEAITNPARHGQAGSCRCRSEGGPLRFGKADLKIVLFLGHGGTPCNANCITTECH